MDNYISYVGKILDDRYKILDLIGTGGSAIVMKAKDLVMDRLVAVKILNEDEDTDGSAMRSFINEAQAMAKLSHKNIAAIYDVAVYKDLKYIVMEYLDGITLKTYIERKGALNFKETSFYVLQILKALEHAHSKGIIHRDIKPQNIILLRNGTAKLTDFGIAKVPDSEIKLDADHGVGTVNYISPEQLKGVETDPSSDIYSLGIVMYEMLTGVLPFIGETSDVIANKQLNEKPIRPSMIKPDISKGADSIVMKALEKEPGARFGSARSMRKAMEYLLKYPGTVFASTGEEMSDPTERTVVDFNSVDSDDELTPDVFLDEKTLKKKRREEKRRHRLETKKIKQRNSFLSPKSNSMFPIIAGVMISFLMVFAVVGVIVLKDFFTTYISNDSKDTEEGLEFSMPGLIGQNWTEIKDELLSGKYPQAKGVKITVETVEFKASDDDYGVVYYQDPREGERVKLRKGNEYYVVKKLYVSVGKQKAIMPDVRNYSVQKAEDLIISEKGLSGSSIIHKIASEGDYNSDSYIPNQVVRTVPSAGTLMDYNGEITLYHTPNVKSLVCMPDLYGMQEPQAASLLSSYNLSYLVEKTESDYPAGYVVGQSVETGKTVERGTSVTLKITIPIPTVKVEDYGGMAVEEIRAIFEAAGINVTVLYEDSETLEEGAIIGQSVAHDTILKKGGSITFLAAHKVEPPTTTAPQDTTGTQPDIQTTVPAANEDE